MAFIQGKAGMVCGALGPGATRDLQANWTSPFERDTAGSAFERVSGLVQVTTGATSVTTFNSTQVWDGNLPHTFNLPLVFYAINDAYSEVQAAVIALEQMAAPDLNEYTPLGRAPELVSVKVGRMIIYPECHIENISTDISGPLTKEGYPLKAVVNLVIQTKVTLDFSSIPSSFS